MVKIKQAAISSVWAPDCRPFAAVADDLRAVNADIEGGNEHVLTRRSSF